MKESLHKNENILHDFERLIGSNLPSSYMDFLRTHDTTSVSGLKVLVLKNDEGEMIDETVLQTIYRLGDNEYYCDLEGHFIMFQDRLGKTMIPIAGDVFGNQVCISIEKDRFGAIYFWYHDAYEDDPAAWVFVANDFTDFWDGLTPYQEPELDDSGLDEPTKMVRKGQIDKMQEFLAQGGDINYKNTFGRSLFVEAVIFEQPLMAKYLLQQGISMKYALASVASNIDIDMLSLMFAHGADPNDAFEDTQYSALINAIRGKNKAIVRALLEAGAKIDKSNPAWQDAINQLIWGKNKQGLEILKEDLGFTDDELKVKM